MVMFAQAGQRVALVAPHQAGVAANVSGLDRRQFALLRGEWNLPALLRGIVKGPERIGIKRDRQFDPRSSRLSESIWPCADR